MKQLNYFLALVGCILMFGGTTAIAHAQHATPTIIALIAVATLL